MIATDSSIEFYFNNNVPVELEIVEGIDEKDRPVRVVEKFAKGDFLIGTMLADKGDTFDIQNDDGSVIYGLFKSLGDLVEVDKVGEPV